MKPRVSFANPPERDDVPAALGPGTRAVITGFDSELDGLPVTIRFFVAERGQWAVHLDCSAVHDEITLLKPINLAAISAPRSAQFTARSASLHCTPT